MTIHNEMCVNVIKGLKIRYFDNKLSKVYA